MIHHNTISGDGYWGVSDNIVGVLLTVSATNGTDRIRLCALEVDELIEALEHHKREMLAGTWCGGPTGTTTSGDTERSEGG